MKVHRLAPGVKAPLESDCIQISRDEGGFELITSALEQCDTDEEAVSEAVIGGAIYPSFAEAEEAGLAWARERCSVEVYIEVEGD